MKRLLMGVIVALSALVVAGPVSAGGWATVALSSTPKGTSAGGTWKVDVTVLQHGRTPLAGVKPTVTIRKDGSKQTLVFTAKATDKVGVYRAAVKFPSGGTWSYEVNDGFVAYGGARAHTFSPITIAPAGGGSGVPGWLLVGAAALALALLALVLVPRARRLRMPAPASP